MRKISYAGSMEDAVQVAGRNLPISRKLGREIAIFIKGKMADRAIGELNRVAKGELAIPYVRFNKDTPHRKGDMMSGRFPKKSSLEIIKLIESLKANAENKALDSDSIKIIHASCQHSAKAWHYGRHRGRKRKLAHFELVGVEAEEKEKRYGKKKEEKKPVAKPAPKKVEVKKEAPKKEVKPTPKKEVKKIASTPIEKKSVEQAKPTPKKVAKPKQEVKK